MQPISKSMFVEARHLFSRANNLCQVASDLPTIGKWKEVFKVNLEIGKHYIIRRKWKNGTDPAGVFLWDGAAGRGWIYLFGKDIMTTTASSSDITIEVFV